MRTHVPLVVTLSLLALQGRALAAEPLEKVQEFVAEGKPDKALAFCEKSLRKNKLDASAREACATVASTVLRGAGATPSREGLDALATTWAGTTAAREAHAEAGTLALAAAHDEASLEEVLRVYRDVPSGPAADAKLAETRWRALAVLPTLAGLDAWVQRWPGDVPRTARAGACERLRKEGGVMPADLREGCATIALDTLNLDAPSEEAILAAAKAWEGTTAASTARGLAADAALNVAKDPAGLERVRAVYAGMPQAEQAAVRLRVLRWAEAQRDGRAISLQAFAEAWPGTPEAAEAGRRVADARIDDAWTALVRAARATPDVKPLRSPPSAAVRGAIAALPVPVAGSWKDAATWSATWSAPARTLTVRVEAMQVTVERAQTPAAAGTLPAPLAAQLKAIAEGAPWQAPAVPGVTGEWQVVSAYEGRVFQGITAGATVWVRRVDPELRMAQVWSFKHTFVRDPSPIFGDAMATELPQAYAPTSDGEGVLVLDGCQLQPRGCVNPPDSLVGQPSACKVKVVAAQGGAPTVLAGIGSAAGLEGGLVEDMRLGGIDAWCEDYTHGTWMDVRRAGASWKVSPLTRQPVRASSRSLEDTLRIPATLELQPVGEQWCGDTTVYHPGPLQVKDTGRILTRTAIGALGIGNSFLFEDLPEGSCESTTYFYDTAKGKAFKAGGYEEGAALKAVARVLAPDVPVVVGDLARGGRLENCEDVFGSRALVCHTGKEQTSPVRGVVDRRGELLADATAGIVGPVSVVSRNALTLLLAGDGGPRWVFLHGERLMVERLPDGAREGVAVAPQPVEWPTQAVTGPAASAIDLVAYAALLPAGIDVAWRTGGARRALGTFPAGTRFGEDVGKDGGAFVQVDTGTATAWISREAWGARTGGTPAEAPAYGVLVDLMAVEMLALPLPEGALAAVAGGARVVRQPGSLQLLSADGTFRVVRLP